ncbi:hypothetical protein ADN00_19200 [Ornatilinea apprima]|uniref:Response regulatory domain-containing protein n=1 Tax=Ornatilinea apprima TaxID=1134406 RepID=A0A0P6WMW5_9CHLR|nr:response regulator [Ornatilinea apprima]KPL70158.1 hypothetical protein ADN00_19200 [Ornatilinea apprima]
MVERILAVDDNPVNLKVVSATLKQAGFEVATAGNGSEALEQVKIVKPALIILDINMPDMDGYEVCRRLRAMPATANTPIVMLTAHDSLEEKIKGFEAGADEYITKPFQPAELQARVKVLLRRVAVARPEKVQKTSKVIAVFSLRGGVGVSTFATNLAVGLSQLWKEPVALVDMVLTMGQSALMLNLPLRNTWGDLAKIPSEELESDLLQSVLLNHDSGVSVLAAPRTYVEGETVTPAIATRVLELLRGNFPYVVLDLPHDFRETTLAGLDAADEIIVLIAPELASVRAVVGALEVFDELGYGREKIRIVMNWTFERKGLARKDIENVMKHPIQYVVPFVPDGFVSAINLGIPPVLGEPETPVGALFEDFAFALSKPEDKESPSASPSPAYQRVLERSKSRQHSKR